jgi:hypothetical protein
MKYSEQDISLLMGNVEEVSSARRSFFQDIKGNIKEKTTLCTFKVKSRFRSNNDVKSSVADPGSGAFLTPGSGIRDEQPGSYFLELRKTIF